MRQIRKSVVQGRIGKACERVRLRASFFFIAVWHMTDREAWESDSTRHRIPSTVGAGQARASHAWRAEIYSCGRHEGLATYAGFGALSGNVDPVNISLGLGHSCVSTTRNICSYLLEQADDFSKSNSIGNEKAEGLK